MQFSRRSLVLLAVVVLLFGAGYLLQRFAEGAEQPQVPHAELTPAATLASGSPASIIPGLATATGSPAPNPSPATPAPNPSPTSTNSRDLRADEARGGHTIARHVGRSDDQLRQRLRDEPDISAASSYTDLPTAQQAVGAVLAAKSAELRKWEQRSGSRLNLVLRLDLHEVIGRSIEQGESRASDCTNAVVVLRWAGNSWFVLTSYPEDR